MAHKVIVVGGGFAGINAAKQLARKKNIEVLVLDKRNHHLFQPLLYQVAMAALSPAEIATPIRTIFSRAKNIKVLLARVNDIDLSKNLVHSDVGDFEFDYLVLACGARHSYFGNTDWEEHAPGLKTLSQATEIRRRVLMAFEQAEREPDSSMQKQHLTFVVVGGGPTGVELAGAIGEISRFTLAKDFRNIKADSARVILVQAGDRVLPSFDPELSQRASRSLEALGVQVWTNSRVTLIDESGVEIGNERVNASTVLWAAGVQPSEVNQSLGVELDRSGRVIVDEDLSVNKYPNVFVIGDQAHAKGKSDEPLPGLAPVAIQQGVFVGKLILRELKGGSKRSKFIYYDKGQMATIGRKKAVMEVGSQKASGFVAWLAWLFIHIYFLIGFRNRVFVFMQWAWHYLSFGRGARLIVSKDWKSFTSKDQ